MIYDTRSERFTHFCSEFCKKFKKYYIDFSPITREQELVTEDNNFFLSHI